MVQSQDQQPILCAITLLLITSETDTINKMLIFSYIYPIIKTDDSRMRYLRLERTNALY